MKRLKMKFFFSSLLLFLTVGVCAQITDSLSVLEVHLKAKHDSIKAAEILEFKSTKKFNLLFFMPSPSYDMINNRAAVSYNFANIGLFLKTKEARRQKEQSIIKINEYNHSNNIVKLHQKYDLGQFYVDKLLFDLEIYNIYLTLFNIEKKRYDNNEITIEEYLKQQIYIKEKKKVLINTEEQIHTVINEIEVLINKQINYTIPEY